MKVYQLLAEIPAPDRHSALCLALAQIELADRFIPGVQFKSIGDPRFDRDLAELRRLAASYRDDDFAEETCANPQCRRPFRGPEPYCSIGCRVDHRSPAGDHRQLSLAFEEAVHLPRRRHPPVRLVKG